MLLDARGAHYRRQSLAAAADGVRTPCRSNPFPHWIDVGLYLQLNQRSDRENRIEAHIELFYFHRCRTSIAPAAQIERTVDRHPGKRDVEAHLTDRPVSGNVARWEVNHAGR